MDSGTIAFRICPLKRTSDAHSGATATDFHRVPFFAHLALIRAKPQSFLFNFSKSDYTSIIYRNPRQIASKKFLLFRSNPVQLVITSFILHGLTAFGQA
jgi:hypothetical protein